MSKTTIVLLSLVSLLACSPGTRIEAKKPPYALTLTNSTVAENVNGAPVGVLGSHDPNSRDTFVYEVVGEFSDVFEIKEDLLKLMDEFSADFELTALYKIDVRSTDSSGLSFNQVFEIAVLDTVERPFYNEFSPTQGIDIVIGYGQSNIVGNGFESLDAMSEVGNNVLVRFCEDDDVSGCEEDSVIAYHPISDPSDIYVKGLYSIWGEFNRRHGETTRRAMVLVNGGRSGYTLRWLSKQGPVDTNYSQSSNAFQVLVASVRQVIHDFGADQVNSISVIWLQGEAEAFALSNLAHDELFLNFANYFIDLETLREDLMADLDVPYLFFFMNRVGNIDREIRSPEIHYIVNDLGFWQMQFCAENEGFSPLSVAARSFNTADRTLASDGIHYTADGYDLLGRESFTSWAAYLNGVNLKETIVGESLSYPPVIVTAQPF